MPPIKIEEWSAEKIEEACSFSALIDRLYSTTADSRSGDEIVTYRPRFEQWQQHFRARLIDQLGIADLLANRPPITIIKGDSEENSEEDKYRVEHFYIKSWMDTLIPVYLTVPHHLAPNQRVPAFICAHGHGQSKDLLLGREHKNPPDAPYAKELAELGCITITMDQWGWAERGWGGKYNALENKYALNLLLFNRTINGLRFYDAIRQVDYLLTRSDVDSSKIGIAGLSLGGVTASWTAAIDTRISMAIVAGYLNTFKDSIVDIPHCTCNYIPGVLQYGEMYDVFKLIAPRPLFCINGSADTIFPISAAREAFVQIQQAYALFHAEDRCHQDITPLGHAWRGDHAYQFVKKYFF
jgi:hypothetical protein